jgi:hypothetical protein
VPPLLAETPLSLTEVCRKLPVGLGGSELHLSTVLRWCTVGVKSPDGTVVRLEAVRVGKRWVTSAEALNRFIDRITPTYAKPTTKRRRAVAIA